MLIGPIEVSTIDEWEPVPGTLVTWHPSIATLAKALDAPLSDVPVSYVQARHLRSYVEQKAKGLDHSRLLIASVEVSGRCDVRAMSYVINAHLRRHDTYRNRFEYCEPDRFVRRTLADAADIEFVPTRHGATTAVELREHVLATPDPLHWDCFRFGVIQSPDRFTFFASIDHLHADGQFVGVGLMEFQAMYSALMMGEPPVGLGDAGSYDDYCMRQDRYISALTADSPEVRRWIEFAEKNNGTYPPFTLPLGDLSQRYDGDMMSVALMDEKQTDRFETACTAVGSRFIGGMFACIAIALHDLTGAGTYHGITPKDTRGPEELMTQGWFTGQIPVTVPVAGSCFNDIARIAQESFDSGADLANVPFERVVELAPELLRPQPLFALVNFFDAQVGPLAMMTKFFDGINVGAHSDGRVTYPMSTMVGRVDATAATVLFPKNAVARESVTKYLAALKAVCVRIADGGTPARTRNVSELSAQPAH